MVEICSLIMLHIHAEGKRINSGHGQDPTRSTENSVQLLLDAGGLSPDSVIQDIKNNEPHGMVQRGTFFNPDSITSTTNLITNV